MLLFSIFIGGSFSFGKLIAHDVDPIALTSMRFLLAVVVIGVTLAISKVSPSRLSKAFSVFHFRWFIRCLFCFDVLCLAADHIIIPISDLHHDAFSAALIDRVFFGRVSPASIWGVIIGAIGALWVVFEGSLDALSLSISVWVKSCSFQGFLPMLPMPC